LPSGSRNSSERLPQGIVVGSFTNVANPDVSSALLGPRTMEQLDDLLAGVDV
jgi:hypothetical protein